MNKEKFKKRDTCEYCGDKMEAKYRNKRFCSDKCRTYWNRENKPKPIKTAETHQISTNHKNKPMPPKSEEKSNLPTKNDFSDKPQRMEGESGFDYGLRVNAWKLEQLQNQTK